MTTEPKSYVEAEYSGKITDEGIERLKARIGIETPKEPLWQVYNITSSEDTIRHMAYAYGDDNPLFIDPEYAKTTRWRSVIAPPFFVYSMGLSEIKEIPPEAREKGKGALAGVHQFWSGDEVEWYRPVFPGDKLWEKRALFDVQKKQSTFAGQSVVTRDRAVYINQRGEVACIWYHIFVRAERSASASKGKYASVEQHHYTPEELKKIEEDYDKEQRRGPEPRYWEDVNIGDELPFIVHGPWIMSDVIAWYQGMGRWEVFPHKLQIKNRRKHPKFFSLNTCNAPDPIMRCHWDDDYARKLGNPAAYDFGILRETWMGHLITNWMGDDAWLFRLQGRINMFNYVGDTTWIRGKVSNKYIADDDPRVDIDIQCVDQRGRATAAAKATVLLPSRQHGAARLPRPPRELEGLKLPKS